MAKSKGATPELEQLYAVLENSVEKMSDVQLEEFRWLILDEEYLRRELEAEVKPSKIWN